MTATPVGRLHSLDCVLVAKSYPLACCSFGLFETHKGTAKIRTLFNNHNCTGPPSCQVLPFLFRARLKLKVQGARTSNRCSDLNSMVLTPSQCKLRHLGFTQHSRLWAGRGSNLCTLGVRTHRCFARDVRLCRSIHWFSRKGGGGMYSIRATSALMCTSEVPISELAA